MTSSITYQVATPVNELVKKVFLQNQTKLNQSNHDLVVLEQKITDRALALNVTTKQDVINLGAEASKRVSDYADNLLSQVRGNDLDTIGSKLNDIVVLASDINVSGIVNYKKSKIPVIGNWINKFSPTKQKILGKYESLNTQIQKIVDEVSITSTNLNLRTQTLDTVYQINMEEYYLLEESHLLGQVKLLQLKETEAALAAEGYTDPLQAQKIGDIKNTIEALEKRLVDLQAMQMVTIQTAPMIRMIQQNNLSLIDKFNNLKVMTVPTWQKQFVLAIGLIEQKKAVELAEKIDNTTNDLLKSNAALLQQNTIATARALQRNVIDIETLQSVQQTLIDTFKELDVIQQNSKKAQEKYVQEIEVMRNQTITYQVN